MPDGSHSVRGHLRLVLRRRIARRHAVRGNLKRGVVPSGFQVRGSLGSVWFRDKRLGTIIISGSWFHGIKLVSDSMVP